MGGISRPAYVIAVHASSIFISGMTVGLLLGYVLTALLSRR